MYCTKCGKMIEDDSRFCDSCGTPVTGANKLNDLSVAQEGAAAAVIQNEMNAEQDRSVSSEVAPSSVAAFPAESQPGAKKKRTKFKDLPPNAKKKRIIICGACLLLALVLIITDVIGTGSGGAVSTKAAVNDTGMVFDLTRNAFSDGFNRSIQKIADDARKQEGVEPNAFWSDFDLNQYWNNMVEPQVGYQDDSGCAFTLYSAFVLNKYCIGVSFFENDLGVVHISFDYDDNDICTVFACAAIMTLSGMDLEESDKLLDTIRNGVMENTMVYKDGILYAVNASAVTYDIIAASDEFVQSLQSSGNCNIVYQ